MKCRLQVKNGDRWESVHTTEELAAALKRMMREAKTAPAGTEYRIEPQEAEE